MKLSKLLLASPLLGVIYALLVQYLLPSLLISGVDATNVVSGVSFIIMSKLLVYFFVAVLFLFGILIILVRKEKQSKISMYMLWTIATTSILYLGVFGLLLVLAVGIFTYHQHGWNMAVGNQRSGV
jgi:hypothetical protein